jgi:hypothetical protein
LLSPDQSWWWDGRRWVSATTADGLWAWNGRRWRTTVELEGKPPEEMADVLTELVEDGYIEAGRILVARSPEWEPEGELGELVRLAEGLATRLERLHHGPRAASERRGLGRRLTRAAESSAQEPDQDELEAKQKALLVSIGRSAPHPTVKEADEIRAAAAHLEERTDVLRSALASKEEADRVRAEAVAAARKRLETAQKARQGRIREAREAIGEAESAYRAALARARVRMRSAWKGPPGELRATLGDKRMYARVLQTPQRVLPAAGLSTFTGTADELWGRHRALLIDLVILELPETAAFLTAMVNRADTLFVLFRSPVGVVLWPCPAGKEQDAKRFVAAADEQAAREVAAREKLESGRRDAEQRLEATIRDRSMIESAKSELARLQNDPGELADIQEAERHLEDVERNLPEAAQAQQGLAHVIRRLLSPPEALGPAGSGLE